MPFLKDALWGGGGVPTGAGLVDGGVDQGLDSRKRGQGRVGLAGLGGGGKGFGSGGRSVVGARASGTEQISQRVSYFCRF